MSNKAEILLMFPGEAGWELWQGSREAGFSLVRATEFKHASEVKDLPQAEDFAMIFPLSEVTTMPFRTTTSDPDLFDDLAAMHIERLGVRPETGAGKVTDVFVIQKAEEECELLSVAMRPPRGLELPDRSAQEFDLSPRALPLPENGIAIWKEFGVWVFALSKGGQFVYGQNTPSRAEYPDLVVAREIRVALTQLSLQGIQLPVSQVLVWNGGEDSDELALLEKTFGVRVTITPRPAPRMPQPMSKLLPADVDADRRRSQRRQQLVNVGLAIAALYVVALGWAGFTVWKSYRTQKQLDDQVALVAPETEIFTSHKAKWNELGPVVDKNQWPVELLYHVTRAIPTTGGLRLKSVSITAGGEIKIVGEAPQKPPTDQFSLNLNRSGEPLNQFRWELPSAEQQTNKGVWSFTYTGTPNTMATP